MKRLQSHIENAAIVVIGSGLALGIFIRALESLRLGASLF